MLDRMRCEVVVLEQVSLSASPFYTSLTHISLFFHPQTARYVSSQSPTQNRINTILTPAPVVAEQQSNVPTLEEETAGPKAKVSVDRHRAFSPLQRGNGKTL